MACGSGVLDVNVDGAVGIRNEAGAVADAVSVDQACDSAKRHLPQKTEVSWDVQAVPLDTARPTNGSAQ